MSELPSEPPQYHGLPQHDDQSAIEPTADAPILVMTRTAIPGPMTACQTRLSADLLGEDDDRPARLNDDTVNLSTIWEKTNIEVTGSQRDDVMLP